MANIFTEQNKTENTSLLTAQRHGYDIAKSWQVIRTTGNIIVSVIGSSLSFFFPATRSVIILIGIFWAIVSLVLKYVIKNKIKDAAIIQEQFDTSVYNLSWNKALIENKVCHETIISLAKSYQGDRGKLKNWYPNTGHITRPIDILICQKSNLVWDQKLHFSYAIAEIAVISIFFGITIIVSYFTNTSIQNYFIIFLSPSIGILIQTINIISEHIEISRIKNKLQNTICSLLENTVNNKQIPITRCREIQDQIFLLRTKEATIPNFWYQLSRAQYEDNMNSIVKILKAKWSRV